MIKSRRLKTASLDVSIPDDQGYCRRCRHIKRADEFAKAIDKELDKNGLMSICKVCVDEIYENILRAENGSIQKTVLRMCRMLNVRYSEEAIESAIKQIESKGSNPLKFFNLYKAKLSVIFGNSMTNSNDNADLTYQEVTQINFNAQLPSEFEVSPEVIKYWGQGYTVEDYAWMEDMLANWKRSHKSDTQAEETLLREIVFKQFEIEKARQSQSPTGSFIKELQDIMKTAAVDPSKSSIAGSDKSRDTFSAFIKMIEENEPADYYEDKQLFVDFDNIEKYFLKYVTRPLKNFITGSRDFNVDTEEDWEDNVEGTIDDLIIADNEEGA